MISSGIKAHYAAQIYSTDVLKEMQSYPYGAENLIKNVNVLQELQVNSQGKKKSVTGYKTSWVCVLPSPLDSHYVVRIPWGLATLSLHSSSCLTPFLIHWCLVAECPPLRVSCSLLKEGMPTCLCTIATHALAWRYQVAPLQADIPFKVPTRPMCLFIFYAQF